MATTTKITAASTIDISAYLNDSKGVALTGSKLQSALTNIANFEAKVEANKSASLTVGSGSTAVKYTYSAVKASGSTGPALKLTNGTATYDSAAALTTAINNPTSGGSSGSTGGTGTTTPTTTSYKVQASSAIITEGASATFTVTRTGDTSKAVTLLYNIAGDDNGGSVSKAVPGTNTSTASGSVTIAAGATTGTFTVSAVQNNATDNVRGFKVSLLDGTTGAALGASTLGLIVDDPAAPVSGQTFTLTTGSDNKTGSSSNDTFDAGLSTGSLQTLNSGDKLDGGAGTDSLIAVINTSVTPAQISGIEDVTLTVVTNSATVDLTNATGLKAVASAGSSGAGNTVTLAGISKSVGVSIKDTSMAHTITYSDVSGTTDTATVNVSNMSQATGVVTSILGVETLTLNATGASSSTTTTGIGTLTATQTTKLNVTGDKGLRIVDDLASTILTVDASTNSGGVAVILDANAATVLGGSGNDTIELDGTGAMSITAGAGNDTVTFDSGTSDFTTEDTVSGGDGIDTLGADSADIVTATASTPTTYRVSGFEKLDVLTAIADGATINVANLDTAINRIEVSVISAAAGALDETYVFNSGASTLELDAVIAGDGTQIVSVGGAATTDSLTIVNGTTSATDVLGGRALTSSGFETVTINTTGTGAAGNQTVGAITATASTGAVPALVITGSNKLTTGVITATSGSVDASGMSVSVGTGGLDMVTGQNTAKTTTGSAGDDDLWGAITTAINQTISGGAGNDTITAGAGNDVITGNDNNDVINGGAGNDNIDGGAGNDRIIISADANLTADDTIVGGAGNDTLSFTADMTDDAATFGRISGFERIRHNTADTITLSNFINNQEFTQIEVDGAVALTFNNASNNVTKLQINATGSTTTIDRLVDNTANALTVSIEANDGARAATLVLQDEETITFANALATDDFTVTALTASDATSIVVTGAGDLISATAVTSGTKIATVDASAATGAVTFNAGNSAVKVTMTAGSGIATFTGGLIGDAINGGSAADVLDGGAGADTINGGAGADGITGGAGGDSMTGGSGVDTYAVTTSSSVAASTTSFAGANVAAGDSMTFANGVDVITDFAVGTSGDVVDVAVAAESSLIGEAVANLTGATETFFASGTWDASTKTFTILADGTGADTMVIQADNAIAASDALTTNASIVILVGVDSDDLVAGNIA